jgi:hypothetical protein
MELLDEWQNWEKTEPPYVLEKDEAVLASKRSLLAIERSYTTWEDVYSEPNFNRPGDRKLHLGLVPHPFCGDLRDAEVYLLMLNPGYAPSDYFAELEVSEYLDATKNNLKQSFDEEDYPFFLLDPKFSWTGGGKWWNDKLEGITGSLSESRGTSYAEARHFLSQKIASLELIPYHSTSFYDAGNWRRTLASARMAREFVRDYVIPKVESNEAVIIATRQVNEWDLPEHPNVIRYNAGESRGAHLTPSSRGGVAILEQLQK